MKKLGFIAMVGVFCLLINGCLSWFITKEIPEAKRADIADVPKLLIGTWKFNEVTTYVYGENGKYVTILAGSAYEFPYKIVDNKVTATGTDRNGNTITTDMIIQIDKTGKKMTRNINGSVSEWKKVNDNHDLTVYAEQIKKTQELVKAAQEKTESEALERKVAAGYTSTGTIATRTAITFPDWPRYRISVILTIKKINGQDPSRQLGANYWVPAGPCKITYNINAKWGDPVAFAGISGDLHEGTKDGTIEYDFVDGKSYELVFEMDREQVTKLAMADEVLTTGSFNMEYYLRIVPK